MKFHLESISENEQKTDDRNTKVAKIIDLLYIGSNEKKHEQTMNFSNCERYLRVISQNGQFS